MESFKTVARDLNTVSDFIRWGASRFGEAGLCFGHGTDNAADEAAWLVLHALHLPHDMPPHFLQAALTQDEKQTVYELLRRRVEERRPAAYLLGEAWFCGLAFEVDEHVLVPRSSLAELIEARFEPWIEAGRVNRVLDLCTGSGCIAIATALHFPEAAVVATDISPEALAVAERNVRRYGLDNTLRLIESDLFGQVPEGETFDVIVSNPPYVSAAEIDALPGEYSHEPRLGLDGGGEDGLDLVAVLLAEAEDRLRAGGILVVEVGHSWPALERRYPEVDFTWLEFERGEKGVFLLTREQLQQHRRTFRRDTSGAE